MDLAISKFIQAVIVSDVVTPDMRLAGLRLLGVVADCFLVLRQDKFPISQQDAQEIDEFIASSRRIPGSKIQGIKKIREITGLGLKDALDIANEWPLSCQSDKPLSKPQPAQPVWGPDQTIEVAKVSKEWVKDGCPIDRWLNRIIPINQELMDHVYQLREEMYMTNKLGEIERLTDFIRFLERNQGDSMTDRTAICVS